MVYGDIYRNGTYKPCDGRDDRHRIDACKPSVIAVGAAVSCDGRGGGVRPQGGGGVDHPTKVQQRKAQTDTDFSLIHWFLVTSMLLDIEFSDRGLEYRKNRLVFLILVLYLLRKTPGVLTTSESNPFGSIIRGMGVLVTLLVTSSTIIL